MPGNDLIKNACTTAALVKSTSALGTPNPCGVRGPVFKGMGCRLDVSDHLKCIFLRRDPVGLKTSKTKSVFHFTPIHKCLDGGTGWISNSACSQLLRFDPLGLNETRRLAISYLARTSKIK